MSMNINALINLLKGHKVWIQTHNFPDPDAIASAYGLKRLLKYYEIDASIVYDGKVDKISVSKMLTEFEIKISENDFVSIAEDDYIVLVDGQKFNSNMTDLPGDEVACIDHHPIFKDCEYKYKDIRPTGACSSIIAEYIFESGMPIDVKLASILYYGIKMDTESFNRGTTKLDAKMFDALFEYIDISLVDSIYNNNMELSDLRAYGSAINGIDIMDHVGIAYIPFECEDGLIAMVSDFILKLDAITISIIYAEKAGGLKFSIRSEANDVHAGNLVAKALEGIGSGGGHDVMAGGFIPKENRYDMHQLENDVKIRFLKEIPGIDLRLG